MDLNLFATQAVQKGQPLTGGTNPLLGGQGLGAVDGIDTMGFWNVILGDLSEITDEESIRKNIDAASNNNTDGITTSVKQEKVDLALLQLALMGQDADQTLDEKLAELRIERIVNNPENKIEQLTKLINHLTNGLPSPQIGNNASIGDLISRLTQRLEKLEASLDAFRSGDFGIEGAPFQALIATGLNPSQLTNITSRIEEIETKLGRELTVEDLIAGVGNIIPVPGTEDENGGAISTTEALALLLDRNQQNDLEVAEGNTAQENVEMVENNANIGIISASNATLNNQIMASQRNATTGLNTNVAQPILPTGETPVQAPLTAIGEKPLSNMSNAEFNALFKSDNGGQLNTNAGMGKKQSNGNQIAQAVQSMSSLPSLAASGDINLSGNWAGALPMNNILGDLAGLDIQAGTPFNSVMQAVNHVSAMNAQPGRGHPATSMVAATISKAAQNTDAQKLTLQLDPPELGRVEIRLEFGANKKVQAHLVIEKPETFLMLQRDMSALEKSLQDAGLDTSGDSINYEMASEDYNFNSNRDSNAQNGGNGAPGENGDQAEDELTIETTMSWDVDPETGHVHYSILA